MLLFLWRCHFFFHFIWIFLPLFLWNMIKMKQKKSYRNINATDRIIYYLFASFCVDLPHAFVRTTLLNISYMKIKVSCQKQVLKIKKNLLIFMSYNRFECLNLKFEKHVTHFKKYIIPSCTNSLLYYCFWTIYAW